MFLKERSARDRRTSTLVCYETVFKCHLMPAFGHREVGTIRRSDIADHFDGMREKGATVATINRSLRTMKAVLFFALERELVERDVMQRFRPFEGGKSERHVSRGAFSEIEVQAIMAAAKPQERALIGLLCFTGLRPGEAYALDWSVVDLEDPYGVAFLGPPRSQVRGTQNQVRGSCGAALGLAGLAARRAQGALGRGGTRVRQCQRQADEPI